MRYTLIIIIGFLTSTALGQVSRYVQKAEAMAETQPDSAFHYANIGMRMAEQSNDRAGQAQLLTVLGDINRIHKHRELSRSFYNEALGLYRRLHDAAGVAHTYDRLGLLDGDDSEFKQALQYYRDSRDSSGVIETYEDIGKTLENKGETEKALSYYLRALTQYEHRNWRPEAYFVLLENIAQLYEKTGRHDKAQRYLLQGLATRDRGTEVRILTEEGETDKNPLEALALFKKALAEARQPDQRAEALLQIANLLKHQNVKESISDLQQALEISRKLNEPKLTARIYAALAGVYRQEQHYNEAMSALEAQHRLLDSVLQAGTNKDIAALDSSYLLETGRETQRRENAELELSAVGIVAVVVIALLLWTHLRRTRRLNTALHQSNQIKDKLFSIIGHDLRNPIGGITQLLAVMEQGDLGEEEIRELVTEMRKQGDVTLEILNALLNWGEAQLKGVHVKAVDFAAAEGVNKNVLALQQQAAAKQVTVNNHASKEIRLHGDPNHFEFLIRNLLSNAIKFSHINGDVTINATPEPENGIAVFSIKDHGKGISPEQQARFHHADIEISYGTKGEKGTGIGLMLCKEFVKANGGKLWLESELGRGSTFYFTFPLAS